MRALTNPEEHDVLRRYAKGRVLEVGSYDGASALAMAEVADWVYCVDPFIEDTMGTAGRINPSVYQFLKNTVGNEKIILLKGRSVHVLPYLKDCSFDFAFIDGSHSYEAASVDIAHALRLTPSGGCIAVHDYSWPSVNDACQRLDRAGKIIEQYGGSLAVWRIV